MTATNVPLDDALAAGPLPPRSVRPAGGRARSHTPPLRERLEDVPALFSHFLPPADRARPASTDFVEALLLHPWLQNVRELGKLAERLSVLHPAGRPLGAGHAGRAAAAAGDRADVRPRGRRRCCRVPDGLALSGPPDRETLLALLQQFDGNVSLLAKHVGRNRKQVYRWMDDLGVSRGTGRG